MMRFVVLLIACFGVSFPVCAQHIEASATFGLPDASRNLVVRSTTDIPVFGPVVQAFTVRHPDIRVFYEQWGSNDLFDLTQKDCADGRAGADFVISSAVHHMVKLVNDACAQSYRSELTARLPQSRNWRDELWGVTREPAVIVYNRDRVSAEQAPQSRFDLLDLLRPENSRFAGRVATYDIEESGLGFLFAFMDSQEATTFGRLLESFGRSGAIATCCSAEIIGGVARGDYLVAYNVLGSYALAQAKQDRRIGVVAPDDYTLVLSRGALIPRTSDEQALAGVFLDFLLSQAGQIELDKSLLVVPFGDSLEDGLDLPGGAESSLRQIELTPALLPALDRQTRDLFIERWNTSFPE